VTTGRTTKKYLRVYVDEFGGFNDDFFNIGGLACEFGEPMGAAFADEIKNLKGGPGQGRISMGTLSGYLHAGGSDFHESLKTPATERIVSVLFGIRGVPAQGDPAFCGQMLQGAYRSQDLSDGAIVAVDLPLNEWAGDATSLAICKGMGFVLDPGSAARTAVNSSGGVNYGAQTTDGALGFLHILSTNGTCTFSIQDSANDSDWATLLTFAAGGDSVAAEVKAATGTVDQYTRWQISLGTATSVTFVMSLVRG